MNLIESFEEHVREDTNNPSFRMPTEMEVCPQCRGTGASCAYLGSFTQEDMAELGHEFQEDYFSGFYDRVCDTCHGRNVVPEPQPDRLPPDLAALWFEWVEDDYDTRQIEEMERRMGA